MDIQIEKNKGLQKRHVVYIVLGVAVALLLLWIFIPHASSQSVNANSLTFADVTYGEFNDYIRLNGQVKPISVVQISPEEGGIVR